MEEVAGGPDGCLVSCEGLYADTQHLRGEIPTGHQLASIIENYNSHKNSFAKNIFFDPDAESLSESYWGDLIDPTFRLFNCLQPSSGEGLL